MRPDRRTTVTGFVLIGIAAVLFLDPLGIRSGIVAWFRVTSVNESGRTPVATIAERAATVESLDAALATDPVLSLALLVAGLGAGLLVGSLVAYRRQRRRIRQGEHDA